MNKLINLASWNHLLFHETTKIKTGSDNVLKLIYAMTKYLHMNQSEYLPFAEIGL